MATRSGLLFHPLVVLAAAGVSGSAAASQFWPSATVGLVWSGLAAWLMPRRSAATAGRSIAGLSRSHATSAVLLLVGSALVFFITRHRARGAVDDFRSQHAQLAERMVEPARCAGVGLVTTSPTVRRSALPVSPGARPEGRLGTGAPTDTMVRYQLFFESLDCGPGLHLERVAVRVTTAVHPVARGDRLEVIGQLAPVRLFRNAELGDAWPRAARQGSTLSGRAYVATPVFRSQGLPATIDGFRAHVRERIEATYAPVVSALGRALVLGESDLDQQQADAFRKSGLLHLLAVSGTHLIIFVLSMVRLLHALLVRVQRLSRTHDVARWAAAFGAVSSLLYADFSGGSGSGWRAAIMMCCMLGARSLGLRVGGSAALGASVLIGVMLDPLAAADISFLLSALATAGLIGWGQPLTRLLCRGVLGRAPLRSLAESLVATTTSSVACAPLLATLDDSMTWASLVANVVAAPLGELVALPACLLHALVSSLPGLERGLAFLGSGALFGVRQVALLSAAFDDARFFVPFPRAAHIAWYCAATLGAAALLRHSRRAAALFLAGAATAQLVGWATSVTFATSGAPARVREPALGRLAITTWDVGQGDSLLVTLPDGSHALVDGGGYAVGIPDTGRRVVLPALRARQITQLEWMVLSHAHPDHISGLVSVAEQIPVGELWIPSQFADDGSVRSTRARCSSIAGSHRALDRLICAVRARGGQVLSSAQLCGKARLMGAAMVHVLSPCALVEPPWSMNDASLVLRLQWGARAALLTGDIERAAESWLLDQRGDDLRADLLKVAHHGSDTSSSEAFIDRVQPRFSVISSGVRNRHRHPRPRTLATLEKSGTTVLRTDQRGSITWLTDGDRQWVRSADQLVSLHGAR